MKLLKEIYNKVIKDEWIVSSSNGHGGVGITLENLLNKERENFELPDYEGFELKTKCSTKEEYISLFNCVPDSYLFEIKRLQEKYGYPDFDFPQYNIFNISVYGNRKKKLTNNYFKLLVDWNNKKVFLNVYDKNFKLIENYTSWTFELLKEKLERKLKKLVIIHAKRKFEHNTILYKYIDMNYYELISFEKFLKLIESGVIRITFRVSIYKKGTKFGKTYDHGTCFNIKECDIEKLFMKVNFLDQEIKKELNTKF